MQAPRILITGATGFIGGDVLHELVDRHPEWKVTALVRSRSKGFKVTKAHPTVQTISVESNALKTTEMEAKEADVVLHFADSADDMDAAKAIAAGMGDRATPGFWIHTSGTAVLFYSDTDKQMFGELREKVWDDVRDIDEIHAIPPHAIHRNVDSFVLAAGEKSQVTRTAIVCPPTVYGTSRGPDKVSSSQIPWLAKAFLERKQGFMIGRGQNRWSCVHVQDLSKLYVALAEEAVGGGGSVSWGTQGYYFAASGEYVHGEIAAGLAATAYRLGHLDTPAIVSLSPGEAAHITELGPFIWGTNSQSHASRARRELEWKPVMPQINSEDLLKEVIETEVHALNDSE